MLIVSGIALVMYVIYLGDGLFEVSLGVGAQSQARAFLDQLAEVLHRQRSGRWTHTRRRRGGKGRGGPEAYVCVVGVSVSVGKCHGQ